MILYKQEIVDNPPTKTDTYHTDIGYARYNVLTLKWTLSEMHREELHPYFWYREIELPDNIVNTFAYLQEE